MRIFRQPIQPQLENPETSSAAQNRTKAILTFSWNRMGWNRERNGGRTEGGAGRGGAGRIVRQEGGIGAVNGIIVHAAAAGWLMVQHPQRIGLHGADRRIGVLASGALVLVFRVQLLLPLHQMPVRFRVACAVDVLPATL